jgi:hypothetical protein
MKYSVARLFQASANSGLRSMIRVNVAIACRKSPSSI